MAQQPLHSSKAAAAAFALYRNEKLVHGRHAKATTNILRKSLWLCSSSVQASAPDNQCGGLCLYPPRRRRRGRGLSTRRSYIYTK